MALPILDGNQTAATLSTIITGGAHIPAHTVVSLGSQAISDITSGVSGSIVSISNFPSTQTIAGTVTVGNSVTISSLPALPAGNNQIGKVQILPDLINPIYSVVTNGSGIRIYDSGGQDIVVDGDLQAIQATLVTSVTVGNSVTIGSLPAISGTVTVGASSVTFNAYVGQRGDGTWSPISLQTGSNYVNTNVQNLPSGALTTRFGSVTTANTAQITSAVTNASRKYLLAQNISAGTVTIGIGFSPTTTQGIQLSAGGGLTFDAFCPTGAVYWLGAVTGAAFTILEG